MTPWKRFSMLSLTARAVTHAAIAAVLFAAAPVRAQDSDPVVARVDGREVHESDIALAEKVIGPDLPGEASPEQRRDYLVTYVTDMVLLARAAEVRKIPEQAEFARRLAFARDKVLMDMVLEAQAGSAATDKAMRRTYRAAVRRMTNLAEMHASHILVDSEKEAREVVTEIGKGGDFAAIARERSKDLGSASEGGDLGWFTRDEVAADFAKAAFRLKAGQLSRPVKTRLGWHVIKVEERRFRTIPKFEDMEGDVRRVVARDAQADLVAALRASARIDRLNKPAETKKN